jgi:hypothetical protein
MSARERAMGTWQRVSDRALLSIRARVSAGACERRLGHRTHRHSHVAWMGRCRRIRSRLVCLSPASRSLVSCRRIPVAGLREMPRHLCRGIGRHRLRVVAVRSRAHCATDAGAGTAMARGSRRDSNFGDRRVRDGWSVVPLEQYARFRRSATRHARRPRGDERARAPARVRVRKRCAWRGGASMI